MLFACTLLALVIASFVRLVKRGVVMVVAIFIYYLLALYAVWPSLITEGRKDDVPILHSTDGFEKYENFQII